MPRRTVVGAAAIDRSALGGVDAHAVYGTPGFAGVDDANANTEWAYLVKRSVWEVANSVQGQRWPNGHFMRFGGEMEQCWPCVYRAADRPNLLVASHDIGGHWWSENNGRSWRHARSKGFKVIGTGGLAIQPGSNRVIAIGLCNYLHIGGTAVGDEGIYVSDDLMRTWSQAQAVRFGDDHGGAGQVVNAKDGYVQRTTQETVEFSPMNPQHVVAAVAGDGIWISTQGGAAGTWVRRINTQAQAGFREVYKVLMHPTIAGRAYIAARGITATKGLWRVDNLFTGTVTLTHIGSSLPSSTLGVTYVDFQNPTTGVGNLIISVDGVGYYRQDVAATSGATVWIVDNAARALRVSKANPNNMARFDSNSNFKASQNGGATWFSPDINAQPGLDRDAIPSKTWKSSIGDNWWTCLFHPTDGNECFIHSHAANWISKDGLFSVYPSQDYATGWNGDMSFTATPGVRAVSYADHGCSVTTDNDITHTHVATTKNDEALLADPNEGAIGSSNGCALHPSQPFLLLASIGNHNIQQVYRAADYRNGWEQGNLQPFLKLGDANGNNIMDPGEGNNFLKYRPYSFYLPGTTFFYSGNQRASNPSTTSLASIGGDLATTGEIYKYTQVAKSSGQWVVWGIARYENPKNRKIYRGIVSNTDGSITWSLYFTATWDLEPFMPVLEPDHNNIAVIYYTGSTGDLARYNGTSATDSLGVLAHASLTGDPAWNKIAGVSLDPNNSDRALVTTRAPGFSCVFYTTNLSSGTPTWTDITGELGHLGTFRSMINPHTGERVVGSPFGEVALPAAGVSYGDPLMSANPSAVRYSQVTDWTVF